MLKFFAVILLITLTNAADEGLYVTLDDHFDFDNVSLDKFREMAKCLADTGPCDAVTASYRQWYPEVVETACARCSQKHKHMIRAVLYRMKNELPDVFQDYRNRHDPKGIYYNKFEESVVGY